MRYFWILCFVLPFQTGVLSAQYTAGELIREVNAIAARNAIGGLTYQDISGSPFYSTGFIISTVFMKSGDSVALPLRYDLYQDEMEFKRNKQTLWIFKNDIRSIRLGDERLVPEPDPDNRGKQTYFFVPETGLYSLYIRRKVEFAPYEPPQAYADALPNRFVPLPDEYYLKRDGNLVTRIINKRTLTDLLQDNKEALEYLKKAKVRINDATDLLELVRFLNNR